MSPGRSHNGRLLSLPSVTALNRILGGGQYRDQAVGFPVRTHASLHDFLGELDVEVADAPSIPKKVRATIERLNDAPEQHGLLRRLIEQIVDFRYYESEEAHAASVRYLNDTLPGDGFCMRQVGERWRMETVGLNVAAATALAAKANALDLESVSASFERAVRASDSDPEGAITGACSTVESVCKCLLDDLLQPYPSKQDVRGLVTEVAKHLNLSPGRDDLPKEWEADIRQVLSGLFSVVGGIGALRTHAGDAHGRGKAHVPIDARIARLAVHAASTISLFYIETWQRMKARKV